MLGKLKHPLATRGGVDVLNPHQEGCVGAAGICSHTPGGLGHTQPGGNLAGQRAELCVLPSRPGDILGRQPVADPG